MILKHFDGGLRRVALLAGLALLLGASAFVWTQRIAPSVIADGDNHYEDHVFELDQGLRGQHGDVCGELVSLLPDGDIASHGLKSDSELPSGIVDALTSNVIGGRTAFEDKFVDTSGVTLISRDETSEILSDGKVVLGKAVKVTFLTGGAKGVDRWEITDEASFYRCPASS